MSPDEHEEIRQILAAHVLHALDEDEEARAQILLGSHVPSCLECKSLLEELTGVAGDLALAAGSRRPPQFLDRRVHRETVPTGVAGWLGRAAVVAVSVAVTGVLAWNVLLTGRVSDAESRQAQTTEVLTTVAHPASRVVPMVAESPEFEGGQMSATFLPGRRLLYLFGSLPSPAPGRVYQVWLVLGQRFHSAGVFAPERGVVILKLSVDPMSYDGILITEETGSGSRAPSPRHIVTAAF